MRASGIAGGIRLWGVEWDSESGALVWHEERSGRGVLVVAVDGEAPRDLNDSHSVRARVGYGGGDFTVARGVAYFVEKESGRIMRQPLLGGEPLAITPEFGRSASPKVSPDGRWVVYVHSYEGIDRLAVVDCEGKQWPSIFAEGHDFYMQPTWSPDGNSVAWVAWDQPQMPWDGSLVEVVSVVYQDDGRPPVAKDPVAVAGGETESVMQPEFSADGSRLVYISDRTGWWSLIVRDVATGLESIISAEGGEIGTPAWVQGIRTFALGTTGGSAIAIVNKNSAARACVVDLVTGAILAVPALAAYTDMQIPALDARTGRLAVIASSASVPARVVVVENAMESELAGARTVRRSAAEAIAPSSLSSPEPYTWTSSDGELAHGLYFPPASTGFTSDGKPPLVVVVHGGPTSQVLSAYNPQAQFLATRGYGVLYVNYRGSTGYGRSYAQALRHNWGVHDVEDSVTGARSLATEGRVDSDRMAIMGGSAGGFTVLQTMIVHPEAFTCGVCLYGVANQFTLAAETHKFEARYTDQLIGPLPETAALYRERSPQYRAAEIRRPLAIFQGEIDEVVLKNQSDVIVEALRRSGVPHEYHVYEGEGHGWRKAETIERYYTSLDRFLKQYLLFS